MIVGEPAPETMPGPDQVYNAGEVVDVATTRAVVLVHVMEFVFAKVAVGTPALATTVNTAGALAHPLEGSVTVIEYVPGAQAAAVYELSPEQTPPVQTTVQELGLALPIRVTEGVEQVIVTEPLPNALGGVVFVPIAAMAELVHELAVL